MLRSLLLLPEGHEWPGTMAISHYSSKWRPLNQAELRHVGFPTCGSFLCVCKKYIYVRIHTYIYIHIPVCIHINSTCMYTYIYIYWYIHTYIHIYIHTCYISIYIYIHVFTDIHIRNQSLSNLALFSTSSFCRSSLDMDDKSTSAREEYRWHRLPHLMLLICYHWPHQSCWNRHCTP